jgi:Ser/Thr protein kinase RdoA (MazF antagonist)
MALGVLTPEALLRRPCRFEDRSSRNRNIVARVGDGAGWFIKSPSKANSARAGFLRREFRCCTAASRIVALRRRLPKPRLLHDALPAAVYELAPGEDGAAAWKSGRLGDAALARDVGAAIGDCHVHLGRAMRLSDFTDLPELRPGWFDPVCALERAEAPLSDGQAALGRRVIEDVEVLAMARAAEAEWRSQCIVHGDIKLSNLLVSGKAGRARRIVIVDWESVAFGDPAWDIAGLLQSHLSLWISQLRDRATPPLRSIDGAMGPFQAALCGYRRRAQLGARDMAALRRRATAFAGVRLLQTAFEQARKDDRLYAQVELHVSLAGTLMREAEQIAG